MEKGVAQVNYQTCMACGVCVQACPFGCLELSKTDVDAVHKAYPVLVLPDKCTGCGICKNACAVECITIG